MSAIPILAFAAALVAAPPQPRPERSTQDLAELDRLHQQAETAGTASALREEAALLDRALAAEKGSYELLWRAARARAELAPRLPPAARAEVCERAIELARAATAARPQAVEGHYWLGASYGRAAEARGGVKAFLLARRLRREMETVVRLQPGYEGGDAFLALGELDRALPGWLGGDRARGRRTLEQGLRVVPGNRELKLALAKADLADKRDEEARRLLQELVSAGPAGPAADEAVVREARTLLDSLPRPESPPLPAAPPP